MLLLLERGPLRRAIRALSKARAAESSLARSSDGNLFDRALGCGTLVYAPASNVLSGTLDARPAPERMRAVLGAASAPGCSTIVFVAPSSGTYDTEIELLRRSGKPYVVVSTPPLLEEIAAEIGKTETSALWIPRTGRMEVARAADVAEMVFAASETEFQGRVMKVPSRSADLATLFRDAAAQSAKPIRVFPVWPALHRAVRPIARFLRGREPKALTLAAELERRLAV